MRRRLTFAIFGIALTAVVLVGLGVLLLAQFGARQEARDQVQEQLGALADVASNVESIDRLGPVFGRIQDAFGAGSIEPVVVDANGNVGRGGIGRDRSPAVPNRSLSLDQQQYQHLLSAEPLLIDTKRSVIGLQLLDLNRGDQTVALLVQQDVATIGRRAFLWFLISAAAVLLASLFVASWLASRFTRPLREIETATAQIAGGDLEARVTIAGDDEVADLGHAVNRMAEDLERSRASEQQFLLSISHDLRTPLTAINGYAEALTDGAVDDTAHAGEVISSNAGRLNRLVADLLDLARLNSHQFRFEFQTIDAAIVSRRIAVGLEPKASEYGLSLSFENQSDQPTLVVADPDRLAQAVANLIDNAVKFAESSVAIAVTRTSDEVSITISDDGPGINPDDLPFVFDRLYVTKLRPKRAENSSGLGLAIVRELVQAMGGRVHANSNVGVSTTMTLTFPAEALPELRMDST